MKRSLIRAAIVAAHIVLYAAQATVWTAQMLVSTSRSLITWLRSRAELHERREEVATTRLSASRQPSSRSLSARERARRSGYAHNVAGKTILGVAIDMDDVGTYPDEEPF